MIDIHSHILWGIDDGAADFAQSLAMVEMAAAHGTTDIVATPHANSQFKFDAGIIAERIDELSLACGGSPRIHRGCDFHLSLENIQDALQHTSKYTINGQRYLLVEFADHLIPPSTSEIFRQFIAKGIIPVITHPERNPLLQDSLDRLNQWASMGCLLQVTAQSLTDRFGKNAQQSAWKLLRNGMVHVIASDAHDTEHRPPTLDLAHEILSRELGVETAELLLIHNPDAIVKGQPIWTQAPQLTPPRKWFEFWK
jgi:protein-tyrosine phosphatase